MPVVGQIKWYKRDPTAALEGFFELTLEERGAYGTILDLIYAKDGNLPDDDKFVAGWMRVDVRVWRRLKQRLIDLGKLRIEAGTIRNKRADVEVESALSRVENARQAGRISAAQRKDAAQHRPLSTPGSARDPNQHPDDTNDHKSIGGGRNNNELATTAVGTGAQRPLQLTTTTTTEEKKETPSESPKKRGSRFEGPVPPEWKRWALDKFGRAFPADREADKFTDYWRAQPGQRGVKLDWQATWRNWCRTAAERLPAFRAARPQISSPI